MSQIKVQLQRKSKMLLDLELGSAFFFNNKPFIKGKTNKEDAGVQATVTCWDLYEGYIQEFSLNSNVAEMSGEIYMK